MFRRFSFLFIIIVTVIAAFADAVVISNAVSPVYYFSGRQREIKEIDRFFASGESIVSLVGISGIGKTEIVREYIARRQTNYTIIWVFESNLDLRFQFQQLAYRINEVYGNGKKLVLEDLDSCTDSVLFFVQGKKDWLFVFDNLKIGRNEKVGSFINGNTNGRVIFSSQDRSLLKNIIEVGFLDHESSCKLIKKINIKLDTVRIEEVYGRFPGHPLLLAQCAYFLKDNSATFLASLEPEFGEDFANLLKDILGTLKESEVKLLIKAANLDNHLLMKNFMLKIGNEEDLLGLTRVNLLAQRDKNDVAARFEMHDLIKGNLLNILNKKLVKENVEELVDQANSIFPNSKHLYGRVLNEYSDLMPNLECLLQNAEQQNIDIYKILELRKNLMQSYLYRLDYKQYKYQLDWFATKKTDIIAGATHDKQLLPAVIFLVFTGGYKQYLEDKPKESISAFEEAIKIINDRNLRDIKCYAYQQYAQVLLCSGEVDAAWEKINIAKEELDNNPNAIVDKGMLYYTFGIVFLERGEYGVVLEYINKSIDASSKIGYVPSNEFRYAGKSEVLLRAGKYQEAIEIARESYKRADGYFDKDHDLKNRILVFVAWAEIGCGMIKESERSIARAKAWYNRVKGAGDRNGGRYLSYISIVEGEIAMYKKDYAKAVEKYMEAEENLRKLYSNFKNDFYGFILEKIVTASALANKNAHKMHYLIEYEKVFGKQDERGLRMSLL